MLSFILRRIGLLVPSILGVTLLAFSLIRLVPGDPVEVMVGERALDPVMHAEALHRLGLDRAFYVQYADYLGQLAHGDLGQSLVTHDSIRDEFTTLFPATLELALAAMLFAMCFGLLAGVIAAVRRGSWLDQSLMGLSLTGFSMPVFWLGLLLIMLFSVRLGWTPVSGRIDLMFDIPPRTGFMLIDSWMAEQADPANNAGAFRDAALHLVLPAVTLGTIPMAVIARMTRSSMLEVLQEDYVLCARARGFSPARVIWVHALRNALIPVLTVIGLQVGTLMGGAVLTETIFSWPGIGKWLIDAILRRDYPVVQSGILMIALIVILVNFMVDVLYGIVNPRIRHVR